MLNNRNVVCISSIDWDFIWQGHQEIMSAFAKNGNRVLFIENTGVRVPALRDVGRLKKRLISWFQGVKGFREERPNLYICSPLFLPFPYSRLARWINKNFLFGSLIKWIKLMDFKDAVVWTFLPTGIALDIIDELNCKCLVYYCIADFDELVKEPKKVRKTEDALIKRSDIIFAQGRAFEEKCRRYNDNVYVFPFGINISIFDNTKEYPAQYNFSDIKSIKRPIIGYIGGIHRHIDFGLLAYIAKVNPQWSLVLVGPIQADISSLRGLPNIFFLGKKDFTLLPGYLKEFDVCIVPYINSEFTKTVYPTKLNEYHAFGKPVVSTDLPEIIEFSQDNGDLVLIANTKEEFVRLIQSALNEHDETLVKVRIESTRRHSWDMRIEEMSNLIEETIERKKSAGYSGWQRTFKEIYRIARQRTMKFAFSFLALWLLVFYTPVAWFFAEPLKITQELKKVDAIVVFAGGAGESGQPGQGYEERVNYAVELYKKGFSNNLIFSSGSVSTFSEPYIMRLLALSLGVPENAIALEDKADSTYNNVKFTLEIINKKGYNNLILVSSPYHMRRASLVFKRLSPKKNIIYSPVPNSEFYSHPNMNKAGRRIIIGRLITLRQIKGILHEYMGIVYYWWKGYI